MNNNNVSRFVEVPLKLKNIIYQVATRLRAATTMPYLPGGRAGAF